MQNLSAYPKTNFFISLFLKNRTWMDLKTIFSNNRDEVILEECLQGEKESAEEYERAIDKYNFSDDVLRVLEGQLDEIKHTLKTVSALKDLETY